MTRIPKPLVQSDGWISRAPSIGFWTMSTALTGTGVYFSVDMAINQPVVSAVAATVLTGMVTATGYHLFQYSGVQAGKREKLIGDIAEYASLDVTPKRRGAALLGGLGVMLVSSWFSFSSMVFLNFGDDLQNAMNEEIQAPLIAPIRRLETSLARIERDAAGLAGVARARSAAEENSGGQCTNSPPGNGPIRKMISAHATETETISTMSKGLLSEASQARSAIQTAKTQADVDIAYEKADAVLSDSRRNQIRDQARDLQRGYSGSGFLRDGQRITCPRGASTMLPVLEDLVHSAEIEIVLPVDAPLFRQATLIDSAMWQMRSVFTFGGSSIPGISSWYLLLFGLFALTLDALGAVTAQLAGRKRGANITKDEWDTLEDMHAVMEDFIWTTPATYVRNTSGMIIDHENNVVLVMPTEATDKASKDQLKVLRGFAAAYGLQADFSRVARSLSADLPGHYDHLKRRMRRRGFKGDLVDIYFGEAPAWDLIFQHQRILRLLFAGDAHMPKHRYKASRSKNNVTPIRSVN